jgi:hypothetical protein
MIVSIKLYDNSEQATVDDHAKLRLAATALLKRNEINHRRQHLEFLQIKQNKVTATNGRSILHSVDLLRVEAEDGYYHVINQNKSIFEMVKVEDLGALGSHPGYDEIFAPTWPDWKNFGITVAADVMYIEQAYRMLIAETGYAITFENFKKFAMPRTRRFTPTYTIYHRSDEGSHPLIFKHESYVGGRSAVMPLAK